MAASGNIPPAGSPKGAPQGDQPRSASVRFGARIGRVWARVRSLVRRGDRNEGARMTIWEHLGELRRRLTIIVVGLLVATCVLYFLSPHLILFIIQPISEWLSNSAISSPDELNKVLNVLSPLGGFTLRFKVSLFFAAVVTSPLWIWQLLVFFLPALKPNERRWVLPTFFVGLALFAFGVVFCYLVILNTAFGWMLEQTRDFANVLADAQEYISLTLLFEIAFGLAFELPLIVFYLIVFNIVPYKKLRHSWRLVYVVLLVFCAMVTPDASPVTMLLMFVAMAILYEASLLFARLVLNKRIKQLANQDAAEEAKEAEGAEGIKKTDKAKEAEGAENARSSTGRDARSNANKGAADA